MTAGDKRARYGFLFAVFIFAIIIVLIINLISLNRNRYEKKEITRLYFADNISRAHQKIINSFNEKYQGAIEVVPINLPFSKFTTNERKELIARSLRSRYSRIDIFSVDQIWVPRFAKWAEPLAKYFMRADLDKIIPQALSTCYYDDVLLGIPLYIDIGILYYQEDLIKQADRSAVILEKLKQGVSWKELIEYGKNIYKDRPLYLFQGDSYEGLICNYLEILGNMGGWILEHDELKFNTPKGRCAAQFMTDLIAKYRFSPREVSVFNERESYAYAFKHDAPFFRGWSSYLKDLDIEEQDPEKIEHLRPTRLPHFEGYSPATVFGGWNLMISKYSENKPEACEFLNYFLSNEVQKTMFETSGYLPILRSTYDDPDVVQRFPYIVDMQAMIKSGIHRPALVNYTKISDILSFYLNKILQQEISAEEALQLVDETVASDRLFLR